MSRSKKLLLLLGVLAVVCVATFCVSRYQEHKEQIKTSDQIILEIPEESVAALSWTYDGQSLAFHKDEVWYYDEDETFPVNEDAISALLAGFQSFGVSFIIEEVEDYGQYGLDDPVCTIQLTTEDADCIFIYAPQSDISEEEKEIKTITRESLDEKERRRRFRWNRKKNKK